MEPFKKLKNGVLIFVTGYNSETQILYGYSLNSPNLKHKSFRFSSVDEQWDEDSNEISLAYGSVNRDKPIDCKHHLAYVTRARMERVESNIRQLARMERRKMEV